MFYLSSLQDLMIKRFSQALTWNQFILGAYEYYGEFVF